MVIGYNFDYSYEEQEYWKLVREVSDRHNLDENTKLILRFCISEIYERHGKLLPLAKEEVQRLKEKYSKVNLIYSMENNEKHIAVVSQNEFFNKDIDEEYLSLIALLFKDYKHSNFDFPYYKHIGHVDLKKIIKKYPNLSMETIRNIVMYSRNGNIRDELLKDLNNRSFDYQKKVCKLIYPISMELVSMYGGPGTHDGFYDFKYHLAEEGYVFSSGDLDRIYDSNFNRNIFKRTGKNFNLYYLIECEYLFQDLYLLCDDMNDDKINNLLKFKEFILNNIPKVGGKIEKNVCLHEYETRIDESFDYPYWTEHEYNTSNLMMTKTVDINNVNFHEKDVLILKKMYLELIPMILNKDIDYKKILNYSFNKHASIFIEYIVDNILSKEDMLGMKKIILDDISISDLINIYGNKEKSQLQNVNGISKNRFKSKQKKKYCKKTIYFNN